MIMLAYTNRFLSYAQLVRNLKDKYVKDKSEVTAAQIANLRKRLNLTRSMQILGISSLFSVLLQWVRKIKFKILVTCKILNFLFSDLSTRCASTSSATIRGTEQRFGKVCEWKRSVAGRFRKRPRTSL